MNRDELQMLRNKAMVSLAAARGMGYSDEEILTSLRSGNEDQRRFADFLENDVMKGENYIPSEVTQKDEK